MSESNQQYRLPQEAEKRLINRLLSIDFPGRNELQAQIESALVTEIDSEKSLKFMISQQSAPAPVRSRIPVEGWFADSDGTQIHVLLHVVDKVVSELEIYKDDGTPILQMPAPEQLQLFTAEST